METNNRNLLLWCEWIHSHRNEIIYCCERRREWNANPNDKKKKCSRRIHKREYRLIFGVSRAHVCVSVCVYVCTCARVLGLVAVAEYLVDRVALCAPCARLDVRMYEFCCLSISFLSRFSRCCMHENYFFRLSVVIVAVAARSLVRCGVAGAAIMTVHSLFGFCCYYYFLLFSFAMKSTFVSRARLWRFHTKLSENV